MVKLNRSDLQVSTTSGIFGCMRACVWLREPRDKRVSTRFCASFSSAAVKLDGERKGERGPSLLIIHSCFSNGRPTNEYPSLMRISAPTSDGNHILIRGKNQFNCPVITRATVSMFHLFLPLLNPIKRHVILICIWSPGAVCTKVAEQMNNSTGSRAG